jgi:lipopolysaccharide export system protein LptA
MKKLFVLLAGIALALPTGAGLGATQTTKPVAGQHDSNAPINISSDNFQADLNGKTGTWTGNVLVIQGDVKMRSNSVRVSTVNGKADKVYASGNVVVDSPTSGIATGDNGVYSVVPRIVVMTGNVVLKKGKDVLHGTELTVNLVTGKAVLGAGPKPAGISSGRVQGVFTPNSN